MALVQSKARLVVCLGILSLLPVGWAFASPGMPPESAVGQPLAALAAIGINPFLALGLFGLLDAMGAPTIRHLGFLSSPPVWITLIVLGVLIRFGKSSKLTKPFAQAAEVLAESPMAVIAAGIAMFPVAHDASAHAETLLKLAGPDAYLLWALAVSAVGSLVVLVVAFDVLIWLSPFPFVDALFEALKVVTTVGLVLLAVFFPGVAVVLSVAILLIAAFLARWAVRSARFGLTLVYDRTLGLLSGTVTLPRDQISSGDIGPLSAFALKVDGLPVRTHGELSLEAGTWYFRAAGLWGMRTRVKIADAQDARVIEGWFWAELAGQAHSVALPGRYLAVCGELAKASGSELVPRKGLKDMLEALSGRPASAL